MIFSATESSGTNKLCHTPRPPPHRDNAGTMSAPSLTFSPQTPSPLPSDARSPRPFAPREPQVTSANGFDETRAIVRAVRRRAR